MKGNALLSLPFFYVQKRVNTMKNKVLCVTYEQVRAFTIFVRAFVAVQEFGKDYQFQEVSNNSYAVSDQELYGVFARWYFEKSVGFGTGVAGKREVLVTSARGGQLPVVVDLDALTIKWCDRKYQCRDKILVHFKVVEHDDTPVIGVYDMAYVLLHFVNEVSNFKDFDAVDNLLEVISGSVLKEGLIAETNGGKLSYGRMFKKGEAAYVMENNKFKSIALVVDSTGKLNLRKSDIQASDIKAVAELLAPEPVVTDKSNKKCFYYGDGARAAMVARVGNELITPNPTKKVSKMANRIGSHYYLRAIDSKAKFSKLAMELNNGECRTYGRPLTTLFTNSRFNNGSGTALTNGILFEYKIPKSLSNSFNFHKLGQDYLNGITGKGGLAGLMHPTLRYEDVKLIAEHVKKILESNIGQVIPGRTAIAEINGHELIKNDNYFPITITGVEVYVGKFTYKNQVHTLDIEVKGLAKMKSLNPKLRGACKKLTAHSKPGVRVFNAENGELISDWEIILGNEVIKGAPALLELFANSQKSGATFTKTGTITVDGAEITQEKFDNWVKANTKSILIEQLVDSSIYKLFKNESGVSFTDNGDGTFTMRESCDAILGTCHYGIELSSSYENYGTSELGIPEQMALSLMSPAIGSRLTKRHKDVSKFVLSLDSSRAERFKFNLCDPIARLEFLKYLAMEKLETKTPKQWFQGLVQKWPTGITLVSNTRTGYEFKCWIPLAALYRFCRWDESYPADDMLLEVFDFFHVVSNAAVKNEVVIQHIAKLQAFLVQWMQDLKSGDKRFKNIVKVGRTWNLKVLTDYAVGNSVDKNGLEVPYLVVNPNSPVIGDAKLSEGDYILIRRNPLPMFTACKVIFDVVIDTSIAMLNPIVWSKANLGDCDGDTISVLPLKQFASSNHRAAWKLNNSVWGQAGYDAVFSAGTGPIYEFIEEKKLAAAISNRISVDKFVETMVKVAEHYSYKVGGAYSLAYAALEDAFNSNQLNVIDSDYCKQEVAVHAWLRYYEELGLGGYSSEAENKFKALDEEAHEHLMTDEIPEDGLVRARLLVLLYQKASYGKVHHTLLSEAIRTGVIRALARGPRNLDGNVSGLYKTYFNNNDCIPDVNIFKKFADVLSKFYSTKL